MKLTNPFVIDERDSFRICWLGTISSLSKKITMLTFSPESYKAKRPHFIRKRISPALGT